MTRKKLSPLFVVSLFCAVFVFVDVQTAFIGKLINYFLPCVQIEWYSAPCYLKYDIWAMIAAMVIGGISFLLALFQSVRQKIKK